MRKIIIFSLLFATTLFAELKVGDSFPSLVLGDQFGKKVEVSADAKIVISFEKDTSLGIQEFLLKQDGDFLEDNSMIYISDVSSLPSFLVKLFVLPKLKKFTFRVALLYDENEINRKEGSVTVITLKQSIVRDVEFINLKELKVKLTSPSHQKNPNKP